MCLPGGFALWFKGVDLFGAVAQWRFWGVAFLCIPFADVFGFGIGWKSQPKQNWRADGDVLRCVAHLYVEGARVQINQPVSCQEWSPQAVCSIKRLILSCWRGYLEEVFLTRRAANMQAGRRASGFSSGNNCRELGLFVPLWERFRFTHTTSRRKGKPRVRPVAFPLLHHEPG